MAGGYTGTKKIFERFLIKRDLKKYKLHFHGLRHTYSNMLFEANQNPKIIQGLLGHKSVKTTITTYNSVGKSYFKQATDVLNKVFESKVEKKPIENKFDEITDEELDLLEKLLEKRKKKKDLEM